jgi:hypothetical protein
MKGYLRFSILIFPALVGCGGKNSGSDSPVSPANNRIFGQSWTYHAGEAYAMSGGNLSIRLFDSPDHQPCTPYFAGTETGVNFQISARTGDYDVSSDQSNPLMFTQVSLAQSKGESTDQGTAHITAVTADTVEGSVVASDDFSAKICH